MQIRCKENVLNSIRKKMAFKQSKSLGPFFWLWKKQELTIDWGHKWIIISWRDEGYSTDEHFLTMHGMPHARLLWWHTLLRGHYAAHSRHWGSSRMGLTRPGYETLVTGQLGFHLFLLARTTHRAKTQTGETQICPLQYRDKQSEMVRNWVPMVASPDFTVRIFKFRIILQHNITQKRNY